MKKSQAAMEFLMTYGWAILVVLISITLLAYYGVLNPNRIKFLPDECGCNYNSEYYVTVNSFNFNDTVIYECAKIEKYINYENRTIDFIKTSDLYICINKTMVKYGR